MKYRLTALLFLMGLLFSSTLMAQEEKKKNVNTMEGVGTALPAFSFELPNGKQLTPEDLPKDQPVVVFYFDPDCDHCNEQARLISEKPHLFEGVTLIWVSWAENHDLNIAFGKKYFMELGTRLYMVRDTKYAIDTYFGYSEVPSIYVYNRKGLRTATFRTETFPEILVKFAHTL